MVCDEVVLVPSRLSVGLSAVNAVFCGSREDSAIRHLGLYIVTLKFVLLCVLSNLACMWVLT